MTYLEYRLTVIGERSAAQLAAEFDLDLGDSTGLDEWLADAEIQAWRVGGIAGPMPQECGRYHTRLLYDLLDAK